MNRFGGRVLPLLLGILFLLGAAWTCLYALFHGMPVLAATNTSVDISITAVEGRANNKLSTASLKQTITIRVTSTIDLSADAARWKMAFNAGEPIEVVGDFKKVGAVSASSFVYEAEIDVHLKKREETASGTLKIIGTSGGVSDVEYSFTVELLPWLPESGANPNTYNMQSYRFYDTHGDQLTKLTKGQKIDELIVTIKEGGISKQTYDDASKGGFSASLNYDIFEPQDRDLLPRFSETATDLPDGCISYTVVFRDLRYNGESKQLVVKIGYPQSFGLERREFTETLPEGELSSSSSSSSSEASSSEVVTDPPTPRIIITSYDYGGQSVSAASNATLNLTFKNMSKRMAVDNVVVKVAMPEAFTLTNSSNTFYFERVGREREETISIGFSVKPNAEAISHAIKLTFAFEPVISDKRTPLTSEEEITIPVVQLNRMTLNAVEAPPEIYVGDASASLETSFVNKGKTPVYNVSASITGTNIKQVGQLQFFGNIESGIEKSADFTLEALEPGPVTGEIVLTYEDANMKVSELRSPFSTTAMDMGGDMPPEQPMEPPSEPAIAAAWYEGIPVWYWIVGGFMGILVVLYLVKLAKVSRLTLQEEQDETL